MRKRLLSILIICFFSLFASGCGSAVGLIITEDEKNTYFELRLTLKNSDLLLYNEYATDKQNYNPFDNNLITNAEFKPGSKWTVEEYLVFLSRYADPDGFRCAAIDTLGAENYTVMIFKKSVPLISKNVKTIKSNPFTRTMEAEFPNPFRGWFGGEYGGGEPRPGSFFDVFLNGKTEVWMPMTNLADGIDGSVIFAEAERDNWSSNPDYPPKSVGGEIEYYFEKFIMPGFTDTFKVPGGISKCDLCVMLRDFPVAVRWITPSKYTVFGDDKKEKGPNGYNTYSFNSTFSSAGVIKVRYTRPNAYGWCLLSIILGAVTTLIVVLAVKKKKSKKTARDIKALEPFNSTSETEPSD
jgi:hypothetical protein